MTDTRVTLCVPTIGRIEFLDATRRSIERQSHKNLEILVLDNASPENARPLFNRWAEEDSRVRVLRVDDRLPMFTNFNRGVHEATGEYIAYCHDDDVLREDFIARSIEVLDRYPSAGFSGCNYAYINLNDAVTSVRERLHKTELWTGRRYIRALMLSGRNPLTLQSVVFRAGILKAHPFDQEISLNWGDLVMLMRLAERSDVAIIAETLLNVRQHDAQASRLFQGGEAINLRTQILSDYAKEYGARHPQDKNFCRLLQFATAFAHRKGMMWAWMNAGSREESTSARTSFGHSVGDHLLSGALSMTEHMGLDQNRRRSLASWIADKGGALGV